MHTTFTFSMEIEIEKLFPATKKYTYILDVV